MQLITLASAAALLATVSATATEFNKNSTCDTSLPKVRVHNRCGYKVHLWSVLKGQGCPADGGATIAPGDFYQENYRDDAVTGVSLKISKSTQCKGVDSTQLEYFLQKDGAYASNYLDVSYVDCAGEDCPTRKEGFYLKSGNTADGLYKANDVNEICPILSCSSAAECAKMAYILPDDRQTKSCNLKADLDFYMCGGEAPGEEPSYSPEPAEPSSQAEDSSTPAPTSTIPSSSAKEQSSSKEKEYIAQAAAVTPAPVEQPKQPNIKTEVVYVTQFEYVHAKRHVHGHRHQHFRA